MQTVAQGSERPHRPQLRQSAQQPGVQDQLQPQVCHVAMQPKSCSTMSLAYSPPPLALLEPDTKNVSVETCVRASLKTRQGAHDKQVSQSNPLPVFWLLNTYLS